MYGRVRDKKNVFFLKTQTERWDKDNSNCMKDTDTGTKKSSERDWDRKKSFSKRHRKRQTFIKGKRDRETKWIKDTETETNNFI